MKTYIALFRGINVGGNHMLPMKDLKQVLERHDCLDVQTYIQSGNVVFRSGLSNAGRLASRLTSAIGKSHGFEPHVLVLTRSELEKAVRGNPFPESIEIPKNLHLFFLVEPPKQPDLKACEALKTATERFKLTDGVFYLQTPDGFGTSKLAGRVEQLLGVRATAGNWRTVMTLLQMTPAD